MLAGILSAAPLKLDSLQVGSQVFSNVTVLGANETDLFFTYDEGMANAKLRLLTPELQKRFNYDTNVAERAEQRRYADDALYHDALVSNLVFQAQQATIAAAKANSSTEQTLADPLSEDSLLGKPAPALEVEKWLGDKPSLDGKFVLVYFWAPWSVPCRKYIPELNALQKKFAERLVVSGVTSEAENDVAEFSQPKLEFASAIDTKARLAGAVGVSTIPSALLVDPKGTIMYIGHPAALTEKTLQGILAKQPE